MRSLTRSGLTLAAGIGSVLSLGMVAGYADETKCKAMGEMASGGDLSISSAELIASDASLPEHCDVRGTIGGNIGFAVLLPTDWDGRFVMVGNGGKAGNLELNAAQSFLGSGYATATTDTGHDNTLPDHAGANFGTDADMEKDFGYRAVHETALTAKQIISAYYSGELENSFWVGCSTGGRQGLMEAQRYPEDFQGYVIGAPVYDYTLEQMTAPAMLRPLYNSDPYVDRPVLSPGKVKLLGQHVYDRCDAKDGLEDGLITDPRACDFVASRDLPACSSGTGDACFTSEELTAIEGIYGGVTVNGENIVPGMPLGSENIPGGWLPWLVAGEGDKSPPAPLLHTIMRDSFNYLMFEQDMPDYIYMTDFDFAVDPEKLAGAAEIYNATDPDLLDVIESGGKIIMYHGWGDPAVNPLNTIKYYEQVRQNVSENSDADAGSFLKLYMVPGMAHCRSGVGFDNVDWLSPLRDWVEQDIEPVAITATRKSDDASRPHCPYPQKAIYKGEGDTGNAESFTCSE